MFTLNRTKAASETAQSVMELGPLCAFGPVTDALVTVGRAAAVPSASARLRALHESATVLEKVPLVVLAGASYGQGSSRDWAAKGPRLLGVRAVIAQSYERIHRSNLVGMGVLPLEFLPGQGAQSLHLTGHEQFALRVPEGVVLGPRVEIEAIATDDAGAERRFRVRCRIDSEPEMEYYRSGGILPFVLKRMAGAPGT